jgi:hypothetical protein
VQQAGMKLAPKHAETSTMLAALAAAALVAALASAGADAVPQTKLPNIVMIL